MGGVGAVSGVADNKHGIERLRELADQRIYSLTDGVGDFLDEPFWDYVVADALSALEAAEADARQRAEAQTNARVKVAAAMEHIEARNYGSALNELIVVHMALGRA